MRLDALTLLLIISIAVFSCTRKTLSAVAVFSLDMESLEVPIDSMPKPTSPPQCHIEGPVVWQLQDTEGYIDYRESVGLWYNSYVEPLPPGAMTDAFYNGFVCNMPNEYKKKGLKVLFTGQHYHAWKYIPKDSAGKTSLYLILKNIRRA